jgi:hypothetical protein
MNAREYLDHDDSQVQCFADWYLEFSGQRKLRIQVPVDRSTADKYLAKLEKRLWFLKYRESTEYRRYGPSPHDMNQ